MLKEVSILPVNWAKLSLEQPCPKRPPCAGKGGIKSERVGILYSANNKRIAETFDSTITLTTATKRTKTQQPTKDPEKKATPFPEYIALGDSMTLKQAYTLQVTIRTSWKIPNFRISIEPLGATLNDEVKSVSLKTRYFFNEKAFGTFVTEKKYLVMVYTDHKASKSLFSTDKTETGPLAAWMDRLGKHDIQIFHKSSRDPQLQVGLGTTV
ncbi:MAG: hypothetical protein Q9195_003317 [Heterodermia aff. obscurata]